MQMSSANATTNTTSIYNIIQTLNLWQNNGSFYQINYTAMSVVCDGQNILLGVRLRQLRMPFQRCRVPNWPESKQCIGDFSRLSDDQSNYFPGWSQTPTTNSSHNSSSASAVESAFLYRTAAILGGVAVNGELASYSSGGYVQDFALNVESSKNIQQSLKAWNWLDLHTRAVFIELLLYNPNTDLFTTLRNNFEFSSGGSLQLSQDVSTLRMDPYSRVSGTILLVMQSISVLLVVIQIADILKSLLTQRLKFFNVYA